METEEKVDIILKYGEKLKGIKYNKWHGTNTGGRVYPFYLDEVPSISYIKKTRYKLCGNDKFDGSKNWIKSPW